MYTTGFDQYWPFSGVSKIMDETDLLPSLISLHTFHMPCFSGSPLLPSDIKPNTYFT
jgi:hypothetical protein